MTDGPTIFFIESEELDWFVEGVLGAFKSDLMDIGRATGVIAHAIVAAARGNEKEFEAFIKLPMSTHIDD